MDMTMGSQESVGEGPYGQPILEAFRRKIEIHGLDLKIPHYADLTKRN
jgi:hypothetical protein